MGGIVLMMGFSSLVEGPITTLGDGQIISEVRSAGPITSDWPGLTRDRDFLFNIDLTRYPNWFSFCISYASTLNALGSSSSSDAGRF